jgi:hypothetical protein
MYQCKENDIKITWTFVQLYSSKETGTALAALWLGNGLEYTGHNGYYQG